MCLCVCEEEIFHSILPHALWTVKHPLTGERENVRVWVFALCAIIIFLLCLPCTFFIFFSLFRILRERKFLVMSENSMWDISHTCVDTSRVCCSDWNVSASMELPEMLYFRFLCMRMKNIENLSAFWYKIFPFIFYSTLIYSQAYINSFPP
jgi:hypothetical protein